MSLPDPFADVRAHASRGDEVDGAPDYLPVETQLRIALAHVAALHEELQRVVTAAAASGGAPRATVLPSPPPPLEVVAEPGIRARLASARLRRSQRRLSRAEYVRTVAWILLRSRSAARRSTVVDTIAPTPAPAPAAKATPITSAWTGDQPVRRLMAQQDYDEAYVFARALLAKHGDNPRFLSLLREVQTKRGALTSVLATTRRIDRLTRTSPLAARKLEGRVRELSGWYPRIPGPRVPVVPRDDVTVLHLVKESRPYLSSGFTSRSHRNFLAESAAGLRPVVVTELGFPRSIGVTDVERVRDVDGIEHRVLDVGGGTADDLPVDVWLQEFAQAAYQEVLEVRPAVIHVSSGRRGYETALVGLALKEKTGLPLVYEVRSFFEANWTGDQRWEATGEIFLRRLAVEKMCMDAADVVITLGEAMRDELVARGVDPERLHVVPNGVDPEDFTPAPRPAQLADRWGIGERPTFGYVSNMDHYRESQETLLRAARVLVERGRDFRCVLVGGGGRAEELQQLARDLGVADHVVFTGPVDHLEIPDYYGLIDVFVVPRVDERAARFVTPLKPFEAMALAKPVVVSDLPALSEIVTPPERGLTFAVGDAEHLADVVCGLWDDPAEASRLGQAGLEWVRTERTWAMNGTRYQDIFRRARSAAEAHEETA